MPKLFTVQSFAALLLTTVMFATGCILVVEEDDYGYGRGHGLYGTSWTLEIFFYRGREYNVRDRGYGMHFREADALSGSLGCGAFDAHYSVDNDRLVIDRLRAQTMSCSDDPVAELFVGELSGGFDFSVEGQQLEISGSRGTQLVFKR